MSNKDSRDQEIEVASHPATPPQDVELAAIPPDKAIDPYLVAFAEPFDADNPKCWSRAKKWTVTDVLSATGFNRIMVSTIMAPALSTISKDLDMNSVEAVMALSAYMLATAFGPLMLGPLSEIYGRKPVLHFSNVWFLVWNLVCGFANSKGMLIGARFLAGFGASAIYSLAGGVLGDVWRPEERGRTLSVYVVIPLVGAAVGPVIGGFMAGQATWRWMFWATSAFQGLMIVASYLAFHETYGPLILHRRAQKLRKDKGNDRYYTLGERAHDGRTVSRIIQRGLSRPLRLLAFHPIIQVMALLSGFYYGLLYIVLSTYSDMWIKNYGESIQDSGLHYIAPALGEIVASQVVGPLMDHIFKKLKARNNGDWRPEFHIPLLLPGAILSPIGLLIYAWTAQYRVFWIGPDIGVFLASFGWQIGSQPLQAYVIDTYREHTSSATAASQFVRSITAFSFPLFAPKLFAGLGYGWGNTTLALVSAVIGIPAPFLIWFHGPKLRAKAASSY